MFTNMKSSFSIDLLRDILFSEKSFELTRDSLWPSVLEICSYKKKCMGSKKHGCRNDQLIRDPIIAPIIIFTAGHSKIRWIVTFTDCLHFLITRLVFVNLFVTPVYNSIFSCCYFLGQFSFKSKLNVLYNTSFFVESRMNSQPSPLPC